MSKLAQKLLSIRGIVEFKLDSWGIWATGSLGIGYPCMDMTAEMMGRSLPIAPLSDQEGLMIEGVMAELHQSDPGARAAAIQYYLRRLPLDKIACGNYERAILLLNVVRDAVMLAMFPGLDQEIAEAYDSGMIRISSVK